MKRRLYWILPPLLLLVLIGWRIKVQSTEAATAKQQAGVARTRPKPVATVPVQVRDIIDTFSAVGSVEAPMKVQIAPKVTGRIEFLQLREGDPVKQGEVVARIDASQVEADVRQAQANVAEATSRLAQAQLTQGSNTVSVAEAINQQAATVASAQADYNQAKQNLSAQIASAQADVREARTHVNSADAEIANANAGITSANANLDNSKASYNRLAALLKKGYESQQDVEDASTQVKVQEGLLAVANGQLKTAQADRAAAVSTVRSKSEQAAIVATTGKANIEAARAKVVQAQAALRMARANVSQNSAYRENLAALRSAVDASLASLHNAEAQRADTVLRSPIDGIVTDRFMDPGAISGPGQPLLGIQSVRQVWVTLPVPEEVSQKVHVGQSADVSFDAIPGRTFASKVNRVNPAADPQSRQFTVRVTLDNPAGLIKTGMFARVTLITDKVTGATVAPREAVKEGPDGASVVVVDSKGETEKRTVKLGASDAAGYQILEGVRPGEKVVTLTAATLKGGEKVRTGGKRGARGGKAGGPKEG